MLFAVSRKNFIHELIGLFSYFSFSNKEALEANHLIEVERSGWARFQAIIAQMAAAQPAWVTLWLFLTAFVAYWSVLNNTLIGDDYYFAAFGQIIQPSEPWRFFTVLSPEWLRPLSVFSWWLESRFFGYAGFASHLINVSFHGGTACLVFIFLQKLGARYLTSFLAALLFAISPIAPEAVTWGAGRHDVMSLFFVFLSMTLYVHSLQGYRRRPYYYASLIAALAGLLSKENSMILVLLIPLLELLYGSTDSKKNRLYRISIFLTMFIAYLGLRFAILGRLGGYVAYPLFGVPNLDAVNNTFGTLLSPLNSFILPSYAIDLLAKYTGIILLLSLSFVLHRWQFVNQRVHKLWLFLAAFTVISLIPVFSYVFVIRNGIGNDMDCSRFIYFTAAGLTVLMVTGFLEFGWEKNAWQIVATTMVMLLVPVYFWGLNENNRAWERSALISYDVPHLAHTLLPDPPVSSKLYFRNVPVWSEGAFVFVNGLQEAVRNEYQRNDIQVFGIAPAENSLGDSDYVFTYNENEGTLFLTRGASDASPPGLGGPPKPPPILN